MNQTTKTSERKIYMKVIDLHTHSNISDGSLTPTELIKRAISLNISAIALTDHDTTDGVAEAKKAAGNKIEFIPGIELSAFYLDREVHIVGLWVDAQNRDFQNQISEVYLARKNRNAQMIEVMQKAGIDITFEKLTAEEGDGVLTRANFSNYLRRRGIVKSNNEAFERFLNPGRPFYIPRKHLSPEAAINAIHTAGGVAILAHPLLYHLDDTALDKCVATMKNYNIDGIEVYYSRNVGSDELHVKHLAKKYDLLYSGGSDFHGTYKPDIELATGTGHLVVPYDILEPLKQKKHEHQTKFQ